MSITQHHILALTCNWHPDTAHMPRQPKLVLIIIQFSNWWPHSQTNAHSGTAVTVVSQIILLATLFQEIPSLLSHCVSILIYIFHVSMHLNQLYQPHFICIIGRVFESSVAVAAIPRGSRYVTGHCSVLPLHSFHWGVAFGKLCDFHFSNNNLSDQKVFTARGR